MGAVMPPQIRKIDDLQFMEEGGNFCIVFPPEEEGGLPSAHVFHPEALIDRSVAHGYDPEHPDWAWRVVTHILHEQHTEAPSHMKARNSYRLGVVEDAFVADEVVKWDLRPEHLRVVREVMGEHLTIHAKMREHRETFAPIATATPNLDSE